MDTSEQEISRNPDGTFPKGVSGNPGGRPKNTMKDYISRKFSNMTDEQKEQWLKENKISGIDQWKMGEGNPKQDVDSKINGNLTVVVPEAVAKSFNINATNTETGGDNTQ